LWHSLNLSSMIISYASDEYLWQEVDAARQNFWKVSFTVTFIVNILGL
jgi:hypothetical protein